MGEAMGARFHLGDCVLLPDRRVGRVRGYVDGKVRVRVRRTTSPTHQFLLCRPGDLRRILCPAGWMSPTGYRRYLRATLAKLRPRLRQQHRTAGR
jgi:hypothetical protein